MTPHTQNKFIQLSKADCQYLLDLIQEMDAETQYTEWQRSYTVPKLQEILEDPRSRRLASQDVEYLLELIEDDDLEDSEVERQRALTQATLLGIKELQAAKFNSLCDLEDQRASRRNKRLQRIEE